jgi:hypothetical protein
VGIPKLFNIVDTFYFRANEITSLEFVRSEQFELQISVLKVYLTGSNRQVIVRSMTNLVRGLNRLFRVRRVTGQLQ